jgi:excisionase family DNA binding protein
MNENEQLPEIMTLKETAAYFRCSERHMQNLIVRGLPHFRLGSLVRFRREEVLEFLCSNQRLSRHRQRQKNAERLGV